MTERPIRATLCAFQQLIAKHGASRAPAVCRRTVPRCLTLHRTASVYQATGVRHIYRCCPCFCRVVVFVFRNSSQNRLAMKRIAERLMHSGRHLWRPQFQLQHSKRLFTTFNNYNGPSNASHLRAYVWPFISALALNTTCFRDFAVSPPTPTFTHKTPAYYSICLRTIKAPCQWINFCTIYA